MGDKSKIEWTDATWNPVSGCTKVSAGCKNCYAERWFPRVYNRPFNDVKMHPERLEQPLRWKRPRRIFVNSMSDLFHESVPLDFIDRVFASMAISKQHIFQVLTKRPDRMLSYIQSIRISAEDDFQGFDERFTTALKPLNTNIFDDANIISDLTGPLRNVWLGVSVENQKTADERIPLLLRTPAAVHFLSCEPLLGPLKLDVLKLDDMHRLDGNGIHYYNCLECDVDPIDDELWHGATIKWVIVGGESGPNFRPMDLDWVRNIRDQCEDAGVPFFFKQWAGANPKRLGRVLDGKVHSEYPKMR